MEAKGTPENLDEMIQRQICCSANVTQYKAILRDYLAQRFGCAMLRVQTEMEQKILSDLWEDIFKEVQNG